MALSKEEILESIKGMSVVDLSEMVKALEQEFGVTAAPTMAAAPVAGAGPGSSAQDDTEEKTEFAVSLKEVGPNKINVIKAVRELTQLGLREAKELVESAPAAVREGVSKEEAETAKKKLEEAGATVTME